MGNIEITNIGDLATLQKDIDGKISRARNLISSFGDIISFSGNKIFGVRFHFDIYYDNYDLVVEFKLKDGFLMEELLLLIKEKRNEIIVVNSNEKFEAKQLFIRRG